MGRGDMMVTSTPSPGSENSYHQMPQVAINKYQNCYLLNILESYAYTCNNN